MRQLHPNTFHERFLASGLYVYEQNGQQTGLVEAWTIHRLPDHSDMIRVDYDARSTPAGITILLEALRDGNIQRFDLHLYNPNGKSVTKAKASYIVFSDHIQISRQINNQQRQENELEISPQTIIDPLMKIFTGSVIQQIIQQGGMAPVFTPAITDPDSYDVLSGIIEKRSASLVSTNSVEQSTLVKGYRLGNSQAIFWLDSFDTLIAKSDQTARVTLKNLARSSNFPE